MPRGRINARLDAVERQLALGNAAKQQRNMLEEWRAHATDPEWPGHTPVMAARRAQVEAMVLEWEQWDAELAG